MCILFEVPGGSSQCGVLSYDKILAEVCNCILMK